MILTEIREEGMAGDSGSEPVTSTVCKRQEIKKRWKKYGILPVGGRESSDWDIAAF